MALMKVVERLKGKFANYVAVEHKEWSIVFFEVLACQRQWSRSAQGLVFQAECYPNSKLFTSH